MLQLPLLWQTQEKTNRGRKGTIYNWNYYSLTGCQLLYFSIRISEVCYLLTLAYLSSNTTALGFKKCLDWRFRLNSCSRLAELSELFMWKDFFWNLVVISHSHFLKMWDELFPQRPQEKALDFKVVPERAIEVIKIRMKKQHVGYKVILYCQCRTVCIDLTSRVLSHF